LIALPNLATATACTTGAHAIGEAYRLIQYGDADVMICGGSEAAITPLAVAGFCATRAVAVRNDQPALASRPWDRGRDGFVLGEGAGALVIEEREHALRRGAKSIAELIGYGRNSDAHHGNALLENGDGVRRVMELGLADAGMPASDIGCLNAHATSTLWATVRRPAAIRTTFGEHSHKLAVGSTKSMTAISLEQEVWKQGSPFSPSVTKLLLRLLISSVRTPTTVRPASIRSEVKVPRTLRHHRSNG
jgi:3-oxoacyl-[acyl-carrier-protein] synthase II